MKPEASTSPAARSTGGFIRRRWWMVIPLGALILLAALHGYGQYLAAPHPERFAPGVVTQGPVLEALQQRPPAVAYRSDFQLQRYGATCGPASLRNVLASLGRPPAGERAVFGGDTLGWWRARLLGMTLDELAALAEATGIGRVRVWRDPDPVAWRTLLASLDTPGRRLIVNFDRAPLHGVAIGHFSPVAGYDPVGDRVLLLDVTPGFGAQLIPSERLRAAINTQDPVSGRQRGALQIDAAAPPP
ncbi:MAG: phytochelatin synthase [Opitutae bacterium]|nr:phytochelatin synthase [Opitutae bacterium]